MKNHEEKYLCERFDPFRRQTVPRMNPFYSTTLRVSASAHLTTLKTLFTAAFALFLTNSADSQQAVSSVITDYQGLWKSNAASVNPVKPASNHNLLAFTYNGRQFSTGVNDSKLTAAGETFTGGDFWALPVESLSSAVSGNTKIGIGEAADGAHNGAGVAPDEEIASYMTDGIKGLNIGTCIANLPAGTLTFIVNNIRPENIGDGIPDILVTQVADPSGSTDRYSLVDASGAIVGNFKDIVFTNIPPVASWTADFYNANVRPHILTSGYTNTDRPMRLWAADLADFGINATNYHRVQKFRINLSGQSDVAFAAYNNRTMNLTTVLPVSLGNFTVKAQPTNALLNWNTYTEKNSSHFVVEKSTDNKHFQAIDTIDAKGNSTSIQNYSATDKLVAPGINYYRLRLVDQDGQATFSKTIQLHSNNKSSLKMALYPNPASSKITVLHENNNGGTIRLYHSNGSMVKQLSVSRSSSQSAINLTGFGAGLYHLVWQDGGEQITQSFIIN